MKRILIVVAVSVGVWLIGYTMGRRHLRDAAMVQRDTTVVYDTIRYSRLDLTNRTFKLNIPDLDNGKMLFIPEETVTYIYRDSVRYVTLPREYFYTKTDDAEIWHSGVQSTIDSLNVFRKSISITETVSHTPSNWAYAVDCGLDYGKMGRAYISPNIAATIDYKKLSFCVEGGMSMDIDNGRILAPQFYWQVGVRYRLWGR